MKSRISPDETMPARVSDLLVPSITQAACARFRPRFWPLTDGHKRAGRHSLPLAVPYPKVEYDQLLWMVCDEVVDERLNVRTIEAEYAARTSTCAI